MIEKIWARTNRKRFSASLYHILKSSQFLKYLKDRYESFAITSNNCSTPHKHILRITTKIRQC